MHVLIFNWRDPKNPLSGGAEIVTLAHAKAWVKAGNRVTWFSSRFQGAPQTEILAGVTIVRHGGVHTVHVLAPIYYLFSQQTFDLIVDEIHGLPFFTPLYVRKPKIAFIHEVAEEIWDYMSIFPFNKVGKLIESLYFYLYRKVPFWTDAHSTVDDLIRHGIPRSQCLVIPCPADSKSLTVLPRKEPELTLVFVSRLVKMKGIEEVVRAFSFVRQHTAAHLWIVGGGDANYLKRLHKLVKTLGLTRDIRFYGRVSDARKLELMRKAHLLLHASIKEGWGLVVMEAASRATPAIVYNVSGLRDSVKNGRTGIVLSRNIPEEMARQTISLLGDKKRYILYQKNCLIWAKSLSWERVTAQSLELLHNVRKNY